MPFRTEDHATLPNLRPVRSAEEPGQLPSYLGDASWRRRFWPRKAGYSGDPGTRTAVPSFLTANGAATRIAGAPAGQPTEPFMIVQDIMSRKVVTIELDDRLEVVREIFQNLRFHHLLVVEEGRLFGVVSDRDLLKALSPNLGTSTETARDAATLNKRVHQIMSRKPVTLHPDASLMDAVQLFLANRVSCIPIVDDDFVPVGILSWRDVLKAQVVTGCRAQV
jgi:acetoin utilization protein AcuB